jgi:drug/metabolite transporter (DMT)-like permease
MKNPIQRKLQQLPDRYKGIACIVGSAFCFALMSTFVRLSGDLPSVQKSFFRNLIAFFLALVLLLRSGEKPRRISGNLKFLVARAVFGTIGILCNFYAVDHLVLSDASMLNKMSPFFAILFSFLLLRERLHPIQGLIVAAAFCGSLCIVKPTGDLFQNPAALIGLLGGIGAGAAYTMVRILGQRGESKPFIVLFFSAFSCLVTLPMMVFSFVPMTMGQFLCLIGAGVAAAGGQFGVTSAYCYAPAKEISVYDYSQLIFAMVLGFLFFGQIPDGWSLVGYGVIVACAIAMFCYQRREKSS